MKEKNKNVYVINQSFSFDIRILHCGIEKMKNHNLSYTHLDRFVLSYVTAGEGPYLLKKKLYAIKKGDLFLNLPAVIYSQYSLPENPYTYYYVAFQGSACPQLLQQAGISEFSPVLHLNEPYIEKQMKKIYSELSKNTFSSLIKANVALFNIFSFLIDKNPQNHLKLNKSQTEIYIQMALKYIEENYASDITVADIANSIHINRSYLSTIFKQAERQSIKEHLTLYRLEKARILLMNTDLTVSKISMLTGFKNEKTFFRIFKKHFIYSPNSYRKIQHNNIKTH